MTSARSNWSIATSFGQFLVLRSKQQEWDREHTLNGWFLWILSKIQSMHERKKTIAKIMKRKKNTVNIAVSCYFVFSPSRFQSLLVYITVACSNYDLSVCMSIYLSIYPSNSKSMCWTKSVVRFYHRHGRYRWKYD